MNLSIDQTKEMIILVANKVIENQPLLTEKDSAIGDGDHGVGMTTGFSKVIEKLSSIQARSINEILTATGRVMISSMGGASGIIFGTMFSGGAKGMTEMREWNETDFADYFSRSLDAIQERGGAVPGDKTMVDALEPAVRALKDNQGGGFAVMLEEAAKAARTGMENTKNMVARHGRAKSLMERSLGYEDPGAVSVWIIFEAMRSYTGCIE